MEKDLHKTKVIFRIDIKGDFTRPVDVFAMFPEHKENNDCVSGYTHIGQHSAYHYEGCIKDSRFATEEEYLSLKQELESLGYNLQIIKSLKNYYSNYSNLSL
jgi:hypothetical protein